MAGVATVRQMWVLRGLRGGVLTTRWPARPDRTRTAAAGRRGADAEARRRRADAWRLCPTGAICARRHGAAPGPGPVHAMRPLRGGPAGRVRLVAGPAAARADPARPGRPGDRRDPRAAGRGPRRPARADHGRCAGRCTCGTWTPGPTAPRSGRSWPCSTRSTTSHRLGIFLTASPRHADVLLVTGAGARGMTEPLRRTYDAMPDPKIVIAVGTDAVSGGLVGPSYAATGGIGGHRAGRRLAAGFPAAPVQHPARAAARAGPAAGGMRGSRSAAVTRVLGALLAAGPGAVRRGRRWPTWSRGARRRPAAPVPYLLGAAGSACLAVGGAGALAGHQARLWPAGLLGPGTAGLAADRLSGLFLVIAFGAAACGLAGLRGWAAGPAARAPRASAPATRWRSARSRCS